MEILRLLLDFGMVVLIWMIQLVVYPSFTYFRTEDLLRWHSKYTLAISILVIPLMFGQLAVHGYAIWQNWSLISVINILFIGLSWLITFGVAVPLHRSISMQKEISLSSKKLVSINWYRTGLWSLVFLLSLIQYLTTL